MKAIWPAYKERSKQRCLNIIILKKCSIQRLEVGDLSECVRMCLFRPVDIFNIL